MYNFFAIVGLTLAVPAVVQSPPEALNADPFYTRYLDADGVPILSSENTPVEALLRARSIIRGMLAARPDLARELAQQGVRVAIMGRDEQTLDIPEQRDWKRPARDDPRLTVCERKHYEARIGRLSDRDYWNGRARGMGGILTTAATENLLALPGDRYHGETILVHEFAHALLNAAAVADPALHARVRQAYADAMARGLWKGEYAATTVDEYWAEGTQFWFESNRLAAFDTVRVLSPLDLRAYDTGLWAVLAEVYAGHRLEGDAFWQHPDRVPPGPMPKFTAEVC